MTRGKRHRARVLFWRGYSDGRIAMRLGVTRSAVRSALFGRVV
jgi:predicted transcriptional regulator